MISLKVKPLASNHIEIETEFGTFDIVSNFDHISIYKVGYDKMNITPNNLISLCQSCHMKTNYNRKYWSEYLQKIMEQRYEMSKL